MSKIRGLGLATAVTLTSTVASMQTTACSVLVGIEDVTLGAPDGGGTPPEDASLDTTGTTDTGSDVVANVDSSDVKTTAAALTIDKTLFDFGTVVVGANLPPATFTITNTGTGPTGMLKTEVNGPFFIVAVDDQCNNKVLPPGTSCTLKAGAFVNNPGSFANDLSVGDGTAKVKAELRSKVAAAGALSMAPGDEGFETTTVNTTSTVDHVFTVTNTGTAPTGTIATSITGTNALDFTKVADTCDGQTVSPASPCSITLRFAPKVVGQNLAATLAVTATPGGTATATLHGNSVTPAALTFNPPSVDFGKADVGVAASANVVVQNTGGTPTGTLGVTVSGTSSAEFTTTGCSGVLMPNQICNLTVVLTPQGRDLRVAQADFSGLPVATSLMLSGIGRDFVNLSVQTTGNGGGTVKGTTSNIDCTNNTGVCTDAIGRTSTTDPTVTLVVTADGSSTFDGWSGGGCTGTAGSCTVTMDVAKNVVATFIRGERIVTSNCPLAISVTQASVFWVDRCGNALRSCPKTGCTAPTTVRSAAVGNTFWGVATGVAPGPTEYQFLTDNNYQLGLSRIGLTGTPVDAWATTSAHAGPVAARMGLIGWGDQYTTSRSIAGTSGATVAMNIGYNVNAFDQGPPLQSVAVDNTNIYASNGADVFRCALNAVCTGGANPSPTAVSSTAATPNALALASDDTRLWMTDGPVVFSGSSITERLLSVPIGGGTVTTETTITTTVAGDGRHLGLVLDPTNAYWGSLDGNLYRCQKGNCNATRTVMVTGARPFGIAQDMGFIYWTDFYGNAIYRVKK